MCMYVCVIGASLNESHSSEVAEKFALLNCTYSRKYFKFSYSGLNLNLSKPCACIVSNEIEKKRKEKS